MSATTASSIPGRAKDPRASAALGRRRARVDATIRLLCTAATLLGLLFLVSILATLVWKGAGGLTFSVFTNVTAPPGSGGGLLNPIVGSDRVASRKSSSR